MSERIRRAAENEALFRAVNEQIETLERGMAEVSDNTMHIVCECADLNCAQRIVVTVPAYEKVRADPTWFFVKAGHEQLDVERVVGDEGDYRIVCKSIGEGEEIARLTDPR